MDEVTNGFSVNGMALDFSSLCKGVAVFRGWKISRSAMLDEGDKGWPI